MSSSPSQLRGLFSTAAVVVLSNAILVGLSAYAARVGKATRTVVRAGDVVNLS